jgi:cellulose synthase/poly-beta-1,6-N-acetylglucosamine synthase-like glycosyltransferase
MQPFRDHVWVIDDGSSDDTAARIEAAGFRCIRAPANRHKPGALRTLIAALPATIETVIVMDPDARIVTRYDEVLRIVFEFQRTGMAALCPRITASGSSWLERIQRLEYCLAFSVGRKSLADFSITSGVAVYRRDALAALLDEHSLSAYAEDLENALILLAREESIYYDGRLLVETGAVPSVRRLFSQRVGWYFGLMRVYALRWRSLLPRSATHPGFAYQYLIYIGFFVVLMHPLKMLGLVVLTLSALNGLENLGARCLVHQPDLLLDGLPAVPRPDAPVVGDGGGTGRAAERAAHRPAVSAVRARAPGPVDGRVPELDIGAPVGAATLS